MRLSRPRPDNRGQVAPWIVLAMAGLLGAAALGVDSGYWRSEQRLQQTAADSAAIAGAAELAYPGSSVVTAAQSDAASDGFTNNGTTTLVTVNNPPASGNYAGNNRAVEVVVAVQHSTFFSRIFGKTSQWVTTRAVGLLSNKGGDCILALAPNGSPYTIGVTGGTLNASTCNVMSDGTWGFTGGSINAQTIGVAGKVTYTGGTYVSATPAPSVYVGDPCQEISGCANLANSPPATSPCTNENISSGTVSLSQGIYCNLTVSGGDVTLSSGLYVIPSGGQLKLTGGSLTGNGVTFYIASGAKAALTGGTPRLSAPTSGQTAAMLVYQAVGNANEIDLTGSTSSYCTSGGAAFQGVFYAPSATLKVTGGGSWDPTGVIVNTLVVTGGTVACVAPYLGGNPLVHSVLAE